PEEGRGKLGSAPRSTGRTERPVERCTNVLLFHAQLVEARLLIGTSEDRLRSPKSIEEILEVTLAPRRDVAVLCDPCLRIVADAVQQTISESSFGSALDDDERLVDQP